MSNRFVKFLCLACVLFSTFSLGCGNETSSSITDSGSLETPGEETEEMKVHFIDTKFSIGDCILIQADGKNILVDGGERNTVSTSSITSYLDKLGIKTLDYIFLSHPHSDHVGGLNTITEKYNVNGVVAKEPDFQKLHPNETIWKTKEYYDDFVLALEGKVDKNGNPLKIFQPTNEGQIIDISKNLFIEIYNVDIYKNQTQNLDLNIMSLVFIVNFKGQKVFLGGDSINTIDNVMRSKVGKCVVMKTQHHGSGGVYNSEDLISILKPQVAISTSSMKRDSNDFFFNTNNVDTVNRLSAAKVPFYSHGESGSIVISVKKDSIEVTSEKPLIDIKPFTETEEK